MERVPPPRVGGKPVVVVPAVPDLAGLSVGSHPGECGERHLAGVCERCDTKRATPGEQGDRVAGPVGQGDDAVFDVGGLLGALTPRWFRGSVDLNGVIAWVRLVPAGWSGT